MSFKAIVKVNIRRRLFDPTESKGPESGKENTNGIYEGLVSVKNGIVNITYSKQDNAECIISFPKSDPGIVSVQQKSSDVPDMKINLVLEQNVRHICINGALLGQLEITTDCRRLENTVQTNGRLRIDYNVEIHGITVERTSVRLEIRKIE